jgi:hypothetical protein
MKNFFISYNKADKDWSQWIDWCLRSKGYSTFTQFNDIPWGSDFIVKMDDGIKDSERVILIVSPDSLESGFVKREWSIAMAKDPDGTKGLLLPIRVRDCDPGGLLRVQVYMDLVAQEEATALTTLSDGLAKLSLKPSGKGVGAEPQPTYPLRFDFAIEYVDSDQDWVNALIAKLEAKIKRVWRDPWKTADGGPVRLNTPPKGLKVGCRVVCAGDSTPASWPETRIQATLDLQDIVKDFRFVPVILGSRLVSLRGSYARVRFWADGTTAEDLLLGGQPALESVPRADQVTEVEAGVERFLKFLHKQQENLDPAVMISAQKDMLNTLKEIYVRR